MHLPLRKKSACVFRIVFFPPGCLIYISINHLGFPVPTHETIALLTKQNYSWPIPSPTLNRDNSPCFKHPTNSNRVLEKPWPWQNWDHKPSPKHLPAKR
ncbi:hypothetical protein PoB_001024900 [Plakobranchus ocellatus]|uniref:Uncharacterized protein n=1 Tax=Plakobranchus ocellatus TaxID=259542 RepID=A0AAV3YL49_9GAST|nr:hypothetical protein PoB_001024900 [Plakobranchus ocellatus]